MDISVIICTYNRSKNLKPCILSLEKQKGADNLEWEVLIVDNNSSDQTRQVVTRLAEQTPLNLRYAFEPRQGLNNARNRGMDESRGRCLAYIDDDITVSEKWLISIYNTLHENDADAAGGRIHLDPAVKLPKWMAGNRSMFGFLGYQDYGEAPQRLNGIDRYPFGGNMAFHRRVKNKIGYFNPGLGRKGTGNKKSELFKGSETDYFHRLSASGSKAIYYQPDALVYHHILPHQLKKRYFLTIHFNAGYQKTCHAPPNHGRTLFNVPLFIIPQTLKAMARLVNILAAGNSGNTVRQSMTVAHFLGSILGYIKNKN